MVAISTLSGDLDSADWKAPTGGGAVGGGGAYVTFASGTAAATLVTATTFGWDLSQGSWTFKFQSLPTAGACAVMLRNNGGTVHGVYLSRNTSTGNWDYVARLDSANTALGTVTAAHLTSNPYIRMRQVVGGPNTTGTFYLDTSPDGTTWTNQITTVGPTGTNAPSVFTSLEPGFHVTSALTGAWRVQNVNGAVDPPPEISSNPSSIPSAGTWLTTTNVFTSDNTYATNVGTTQNTEYPLDVGGFNFSAIPADSTIGSVTVTIEAKTGTAARAQIKGELYDGATLLTGSLALTNLTAADANYTFAPTATLAQLQSANLKVRVTNKRTVSQASTTSVDWVKIDVTYIPPATVTQAAYRFYADGTETGSTALAAQDTAYTADLSAGDANLLLRTRLQSTNATALGGADDWQLQYEKNASGTWTDVGALTLVDSYAETNADNAGFLIFAADISGQSFLGTGTKLTRAGFWLRKVGAPPGTITAQLYAHTGTYGSTGIGTGSPLATATARSASTLQTTAQWEYFDFDGTFTLAAGTPYVIAVKTSTDTDPSNAVVLTDDISTATHAGNESVYVSPNPTWSPPVGGRDLVFRVYGPSTAPVVPYNSANLTDGAATTNRLGAGTGSFTAGEVSETGVAADLGWPGNNHTEVLYALTLVKAALANSDTVRFRVLRNGATTGLTYTAVPTIPVTIGAGGATQTAAGSLAGTAATTATSTVVHEASASLPVTAARSAASDATHEALAARTATAALVAAVTATVGGVTQEASATLALTASRAAAVSVTREALAVLALTEAAAATSTVTEAIWAIQGTLPVAASGAAVGSVVHEATAALAVTESGAAAGVVAEAAWDIAGTLAATASASAVMARTQESAAALAPTATTQASATTIHEASAALTSATITQTSASVAHEASASLSVIANRIASASADHAAISALATAATFAAAAARDLPIGASLALVATTAAQRSTDQPSSGTLPVLTTLAAVGAGDRAAVGTSASAAVLVSAAAGDRPATGTLAAVASTAAASVAVHQATGSLTALVTGSGAIEGVKATQETSGTAPLTATRLALAARAVPAAAALGVAAGRAGTIYRDVFAAGSRPTTVSSTSAGTTTHEATASLVVSSTTAGMIRRFARGFAALGVSATSASAAAREVDAAAELTAVLLTSSACERTAEATAELTAVSVLGSFTAAEHAATGDLVVVLLRGSLTHLDQSAIAELVVVADAQAIASLVIHINRPHTHPSPNRAGTRVSSSGAAFARSRNGTRLVGSNQAGTAGSSNRVVVGSGHGSS